jgi:hypothetical protein
MYQSRVTDLGAAEIKTSEIRQPLDVFQVLIYHLLVPNQVNFSNSERLLRQLLSSFD